VLDVPCAPVVEDDLLVREVLPVGEEHGLPELRVVEPLELAVRFRERQQRVAVLGDHLEGEYPAHVFGLQDLPHRGRHGLRGRFLAALGLSRRPVEQP